MNDQLNPSLIGRRQSRRRGSGSLAVGGRQHRSDVNCVNRLSDALVSLKEKSPAVILLDLNLPDSHGAETFRRVLESAPDVPVVILSGQDDEALAMKALHQGVQDYLVKGTISSVVWTGPCATPSNGKPLLRSLEMSRKQQLEFKNQFLSHVSHELRTPLTCIHQFVTDSDRRPGRRSSAGTA